MPTATSTLPRTPRPSLEARLGAAALALATGACVAAASGPAAAPAASGPAVLLSCELQVPDRVRAGAPVPLTMRLRNPGTVAVAVLTWGTPFEAGWFAPYVDVLRDGVPLRYRGAMVKRGDPLAEHYLRIEPGALRETHVDMALVFDLKPAGRYRVEPNIVLQDVVAGNAGRAPRPRDQFDRQPLRCSGVSFTVEG